VNEEVRYQPPLRSAAMWALNLDHGAVPHETLAVLAGVADDRAKAYSSILVEQGAALDTPAGLVRGPRFVQWAERTSSARPRGASARVAEEMAAMQRNVWLRVRLACRERQWRPSQLASASGVHGYAIARFLAHGKPPLTAVALVLVARALDTTAEGLMAPAPTV
jgi:hypothetical protein